MHPASFAKKPPRYPRRLLCVDRPPPLKSCLAIPDLDDDLDALPSDEPFVRKSVHFPDDEDLVQVKTIPARPPRLTELGKFKVARPGDDSRRMCILYYSPATITNARFLRQRPDDLVRPRFETRNPWGSVQRSYRFAAAYATEPRSPRSGPVPDGPQHTPEPPATPSDGSLQEPASDGSLDAPTSDGPLPATSSDGSSLEPAFDGSHAPSADLSSLTRALPSNHAASDMPSALHALPDPDAGPMFDMSSLMRALPDPDDSSNASPIAPVPEPLDASITRRRPEVEYIRVVQTHVQVGPLSTTWFNRLCWLIVLVAFFPSLMPAAIAVLALLFLYGAYTSSGGN
ncbi:hypothetical protein N7457_004137 [Penicillium paradoxum]|uniref:uncharacterized protein n=1 Tax=Penicillium paradoxum TaxID=176176 RepID=UPI0025492002|nr:uncharacterized protein N7457_004137 [Penicillium paradoxum]KAJ5782363.1 hypothetical protein N7457_004137 [Penicillium paradoxum]